MAGPAANRAAVVCRAGRTGGDTWRRGAPGRLQRRWYPVAHAPLPTPGEQVAGGPVTDEPDLYRVLGVHPSADLAAIRTAYRRLARRYHPDLAPEVHPDDVRRMAEINRAWETLRDRGRREAYDRRRSLAGSGYVSPGPTAPATSTTRATRPASAAPPSGNRRAGGDGHATARATAPAGPPPGRPDGSVLGFGRYAGWSLGQVAARDPDFLEWLERSSSGRPYRDEIDALLRRLGRRSTDPDPLARPGRFRR